MKALIVLMGAGTLMAAAPASGAGTYVNLGDSVARGVGAPSREQGASGIFYAYLHSAEGGSADVWADPAGEGPYGDQDSSTIRSSGQLGVGLAAIDDPSDTLAVTLTIGGNDRNNPNCGPGKWNTDTCPYKANLAAILDDIQAALARDPGTEKLVVTMYYNPAAGQANGVEAAYDAGLLGTDGKIDCAGTGDQQGLDDVISCTALAHGAVPADTYTPSKRIGQAFMSGDGTHPSATGHQAIAEAWRDAFLGRASGPISVPPPSTPPTIADTVAGLLGIPKDGSRLKVSRSGFVTIGKPSMCPPACGSINVAGRAAGHTVLRISANNSNGSRPGLRGRLSASARRKVARRGRLSVIFRFTGAVAGDRVQNFEFSRRYVLKR